MLIYVNIIRSHFECFCLCRMNIWSFQFWRNKTWGLIVFSCFPLHRRSLAGRSSTSGTTPGGDGPKKWTWAANQTLSSARTLKVVTCKVLGRSRRRVLLLFLRLKDFHARRQDWHPGELFLGSRMDSQRSCTYHPRGCRDLKILNGACWTTCDGKMFGGATVFGFGRHIKSVLVHVGVMQQVGAL